MQATTSVNVIRALGLVCETGLISSLVEALWSRPYRESYIDRQPVIFARTALHMATPSSPIICFLHRLRSLGTGMVVISIPGMPVLGPEQMHLSLMYGAVRV